MYEKISYTITHVYTHVCSLIRISLIYEVCSVWRFFFQGFTDVK